MIFGDVRPGDVFIADPIYYNEVPARPMFEQRLIVSVVELSRNPLYPETVLSVTSLNVCNKTGNTQLMTETYWFSDITWWGYRRLLKW